MRKDRKKKGTAEMLENEEIETRIEEMIAKTKTKNPNQKRKTQTRKVEAKIKKTLVTRMEI